MKMNKKNGQKKLLAAFVILAMIAFAFTALPAEADAEYESANAVDSDGVFTVGPSGTGDGTTSLDDLKEYAENNEIDGTAITAFYFSDSYTFTDDITFTVPIIVNTGKVLTVNSGVTLSVDVDVNITSTNSPTQYNAISGAGYTITGDGTLKVEMGGTMELEQGGWSDATSNKAAAISSTGALTLSVKNVDIDVTTVTTDSDNDDTQNMSVYGIQVTGTSTIGTSNASSKMSLDVNVNPDDRLSTGIGTTGTSTLTFNAVTGTVEAGNRGIYTYDDTLIFKDSVMTVKGSEKAIHTGLAGTLELGATSSLNPSEIRAELSGSANNNAGNDDYFGVKTQNLEVYVGSELVTDGLRLLADGTNVLNGVIVVNGGYEQNPNADIKMRIAGLYNEGANLAATAGAVPSTGAAGVYLANGAETYGLVTITEGGQTVSQTMDGTSTDASDYNTKLSGSTTQVVTVNKTGGLVEVTDTIVVPLVEGSDSKTLNIISAGSGFTATIAVAKNAAGEAGTNTVSLSGFVGSLSITEGSVVIEGVITSGTVTVSGDVKLGGTLEVAGTGQLVVSSGSTLNLQGNTLKVKDIKTVIGTDGSIVFDGTAKAIGEGNLILDGTAATLDSSFWQATGTAISGTGIVFAGSETYGTTTISEGTVAGTFNAGTLIIDGSVTVGTTGLTIGEKAKVTVKEGSTLDAGEYALTNNGTMNVYGAVDLTEGTGSFTNNGLVTLMGENASVPTTIGGTGTLDAGAIQKNVYLSGDIKTTIYGIESIVTIERDSTLLKGTQLSISGTLIIADGVTLTIVDGAQLLITGSYAKMVNDGQILVESDITADETYTTITGTDDGDIVTAGGFVVSGGSVENNGEISLAYSKLSTDVTTNAVMTVVAGSKFVNSGDLNVQVDNKLDVDTTGTNGRFTNEGTVSVYGVAEIAQVYNEGTILVDGTFDGAVKQSAVGATVQIDTMVDDTGISVDDTEITGKNMDTATNSISVNAANTYSVSGITISSEIESKKAADGTTKNYRNMLISGSVSADSTPATVAASPAPAATITIDGKRVYVEDTLDIAKGITLTGSSKTEDTLNVVGTMTAQEDSSVQNLTADVTGSMTMFEDDINANAGVVGARYVVKTTGANATQTFYYTVLDAAIVGAQAASVKTVDLYGDTKVSNDVEVPAEMTIKQQSGTLTIAEGTTVTVKATGKIDQVAGTIDVLGTLLIEDRKTGLAGTTSITSDVKSEGEKDVRYTSLSGAIAAAGTTDTVIKLNRDVELKTPLVITPNVTVDTNDFELEVIGAKLTIDGTLFINGDANDLVLTATTGTLPVNSEIVVVGYIKSGADLAYGAKFPAGVYYTSGTYNYITSLTNAPAAMAVADGSEIDIYGKVSAGDLEFVGTSDEVATINVKMPTTTIAGSELFNAGTITLDNAIIKFDDGRLVNAIIAGADGSIKMVDVEVDVAGLTVSVTEDSEGVEAPVITGKAVSATGKTKSYLLAVDGSTVLKDLVLAAVAENVSLTVDGTALVTGTAGQLADVLVNGTLTVDNAASCTIGTATVLGTLQALEATSSKAAGTVSNITKLLVGITADDLLKMPGTGAVATVTGAVDPAVVYVADGASVPEAMVKDMKTLTFHVEDAIWFTAYADDAATVVTVNAIPVADVEFGGWSSTADLKNIVDTDEVAEGIQNAFTFGADYKDLYAVIDYDVYTVIVNTDGGIASVAIDGNLLINALGGTFITDNGGVGSPLKAGTHKLTYTLKSGYEGEAVMTIDGTAVSGYTFELSGDFTEDIVINLAGTSPVTSQPVVIENGDDSGMGLTDILLIVLVVLILIMAIIVAMRLMRN